jgi:hypothetical protein
MKNNTNKKNKIWTPYKTNGSQDEPIIVFTQNRSGHHNMNEEGWDCLFLTQICRGSCCPITCFLVLISMLWCPLRFCVKTMVQAPAFCTTPSFSVDQSLVFCVMCCRSVGHCCVFPSFYVYWLPLWYFQIFLCLRVSSNPLTRKS